MSQKIGISVIAAGGRSQMVVKNLLRDGERVKIISVFDPNKKQAAAACAAWGQSDIKICDSVQDAINQKGVEWVMIFSPNAFHREQIVGSFAAGKNVFSEKPLATSIEDCKLIYDAHIKSGRQFATGFVLRYAPIYRKVKEILDSGSLGRILSIDTNENIAPDHGAYIMKNWRRHQRLAGPHILEKCCHDLDLINWFTGSIASKVASVRGARLLCP
jgi:predicted dehydrogenase